MGKLISQSNNTLVYMESDGQLPIIWKVCGNAKNSVTDLANEFTITRGLDIKGVRKAVASGIYNNKEGFSYEFFDGILLKEWIQNNPFDIQVFFKIALKITEILKELHNAGVCHLRINSNNILYNTSTGDVEIIDLSFSSKGPVRRYINFEEVSYELSYIAPEQTGRLNQLVDNRADLYSLGIVFHEMLTGRLPFEEKDKAMLVHMHLVLVPTPVVEINKAVPAIISKIVDKLLCKNPEERYQTIYGLEQDLALCAREYFKSGELYNFPLGSYDHAYRLNLSQKLFGRDHEIIKIQNSIRSIKHGGYETYIITGDAGSGKSAFVQCFRRLGGNNEGIMLSGKFDVVSKNVPHSAMINALKELSAIILTEPNETLVNWKQLIKKTVAGNEKLFTDLVPEFKWIIEDVTAERISDDNSDEEINFDKTFSDILKGAALLKKYVILFLDDLHYADTTSLKSIRSIVADNSISRLLLVLSYKKNAGDKEVKTTTFINEVKEIKKDFVEIEMKNLAEEEILALINDSFDTAEPQQLSAIVYKKTFGNPFFVHQLLHSCFSKNILQFNHDQQKWLWNRNKLLQINITDNVIEYMTDKVQQLATETLELVTHAACIGNEFMIDILSEILSIPIATLQAQLQSLCKDHLIENKEHGRYQFVHDKLWQVVNDLIPGEKKSKIHYTIAKTFFRKGIQKISGSQLYKIASHFDAGKTHIQRDERFIVAQLSLKAGLEAKRSGAFDFASNYLSSAAEMISESDWSDRYEIALKLYLEATEVALIAGKRTEAETFLTETISKAKTIGDRVKAYEIKLYHLSENHHFLETISLLLHVLDEVGFSIKRNPGKITLLKEYALVKWYLKDKKIHDLLSLPLMENERANIFMRLTVNSLAGIFGAAPDILPLVIFRQVQLSIKYGNSIYAPFAYCFYGFALCAFMNNLEKGYAFGKMSLELTEKLHADIVKTKVLVSFYGFLSYWKDSLRVSVGPLNEAYATGQKTGDLFYAAFALSFQSSIRLHAGDYLPELMEVMTQDCETIKGMNQDLVYNISESQRQFVINLTNEVGDPLILSNEGFNEDVFLDNLVKMNDEASKFDFYYYKMALASIFNIYDEAFKNSELCCKYEDETTSRQITYPSYILHAVIATFKDLAKAQPSLPKDKLLKKINSKIKLLHEFSKYAPQNFRNKLLLAQAYMWQHSGNLNKATDYAYQSVLQAQKNNFVHEEALAREYLSYLYRQEDNQEYADMMLKSAFNSYQKWGAYGKCQQLKNTNKEVLSEALIRGNVINISNFQNIYDLNTIINANQALSLENTLEGLLKKMLDLVIQNGSVDNAVIIIKSKDEQFVPLAQGNNEKIEMFDSGGEENYRVFPISLINYVVRTKSVFVSNKFLLEKKFTFDTYNQLRRPVSVCAIPLITKNNVVGVLYLENNLAEDAFDNRRVEFFKTISAQLNISMDNVLLYNEMEQKVKDRTSELNLKNFELESEKKKSDDLLLSILPKETAEELKNFGKTTARLYKSVTVLFTDIKSFSKIAGTLSPEELVSELDHVFINFDKICSDYNLEKIKTIGDGYMAVAGLPENNDATAIDVVRATIKMQEFTIRLADERKQQGRQYFEIRFGLHTGPVIAGVVGQKKFQFDIWGDTVNIAARMEQSSIPGKINISKTTYDIVKDNFNCTPRGKIVAKNIGEVEMYFVENENSLEKL